MNIRPRLFFTAFGLSVLISMTLRHSEASAQTVSIPRVTTSSPSLTPSTTPPTTTGEQTGLTNANGQSIFDNSIRSNSCMDTMNQHLCGVEARDYCRQNTALSACQNIISELKNSTPATTNY